MGAIIQFYLLMYNLTFQFLLNSITMLLDWLALWEHVALSKDGKEPTAMEVCSLDFSVIAVLSKITDLNKY